MRKFSNDSVPTAFVMLSTDIIEDLVSDKRNDSNVLFAVILLRYRLLLPKRYASKNIRKFCLTFM
jgi:hypothetical protein